MIHELKKDDYEKVRPLCKELDYHLTMQAVIDGRSAFQQVFALKDDAPPHYWYHSAAMAYAGMGDAKTAFSYLHTAIERGWQALDFTKNCEEFAGLHETPEWENMLAQFQEGQEKK